MCSETGLVLREDLLESLDVHQEITQGLHEEETVRIGKVGKSVASRENSLSVGSEAGRYLLNRKSASMTGTQGMYMGWCQAEANLCKIYGFGTLFQKLLEVTEESAGGKLDT